MKKIGDSVRIKKGTLVGNRFLPHAVAGVISEVKQNVQGQPMYGITYKDAKGKEKHTWALDTEIVSVFGA